MRRSLLAVALLLAVVAGMAPAGAKPPVKPQLAKTVKVNPGDAHFASDNLEYISTLPIDAPGVGARVVQIGEQKRLYVTGVQSLTIYDVTNAASPTILGRLELPNWENEDVAVSADGKTVLISEFTGTYLHVIRVDDGPNGTLLPQRVGFSPLDNGHIVSCIDTNCDWVYGSEGSIIDLRDKANPVHLDQGWAAQLKLSTSGHNIEVITPTTCTYDEAGAPTCPGSVVSADVTPITILDTTDPTKPTIIAQADAKDMSRNKTAYQHNNKLPSAALYDPRDTEEEILDPNLRPGELMLSNGETNFTMTPLGGVGGSVQKPCTDGNGPFATYSAKGWREGAPLQVVDILRPVTGEYANGDPRVNAMGCSGHWFDHQPEVDENNEYTVTAAWYEHGTRLIKVNAATGKIRQVGFFQPVVGAASQSLWIDSEYVYTIDYQRGIDILRYDKTKNPPTETEINESWMANIDKVSPLARQERLICRLAQNGRLNVLR